MLNFNIFSERGSRSSRGSSINSRVRVGHGVTANGVSKNAGKTSLDEQIDLLSKIRYTNNGMLLHARTITINVIVHNQNPLNELTI